MDTRRAAMALFLKYPEPGAVKTRLNPALGPERAARFYWECALLVLAKALRLKQIDLFAFFTPPERRSDIESLVMARFGSFEGRFVAQEGPDLGERMHRALAYLGNLGYPRALVLGTDSPTIPTEYLARAVDEIERHDCVIGPTWDGGFYLIGVERSHPGIFENVAWSSGTELGQTYDNLVALGYDTFLLPRWQDIDTADDLPFLEGQVRHADYRRLKAILNESEPAA